MTERPRLIRRNTWTKLEGDLTTETTSRSEFKGFEQVTRTESVQRRQDNLTVGGAFHVSRALVGGASAPPDAAC